MQFQIIFCLAFVLKPSQAFSQATTSSLRTFKWASIKTSSFSSTTMALPYSSTTTTIFRRGNKETSSSSSSLLSASNTDEEEIISSTSTYTTLNPTFHKNTPLHSSTYTQVLSTNTLRPIATKLREVYDDHFCDPRQPNSRRFAWDPWFVSVGDGVSSSSTSLDIDNDIDGDQDDNDKVEGELEAIARQDQYSLKRIQSSFFFSPPESENTNNDNDDDDKSDNNESDLYMELVDNLTMLGKSIGLTAITPPWTSIYTNGDLQNFHTDAPHGPMAFVLSLCLDESDKNGGSRNFEGGETMMFRKEMMDFWRGFDSSKGLECGDIIRYIPPTPLGRCIAFDPRVPHGVNRVIGSQDPRRARVVIHGWFNEPENCWFGPWADDGEIDKANGILETGLEPLIETLGSGEIGRVVGYLAVRIEIDADGYVEDVTAVCDTVQADMDDYRGIIGYDEAERPVMEDAVSDVRLTIFENLKNLIFNESGEEGRAIVIPFFFE